MAGKIFISYVRIELEAGLGSVWEVHGRLVEGVLAQPGLSLTDCDRGAQSTGEGEVG